MGGASGRGWDRAEWTGHAEVVVSRWELVMSSRALMSGMTGCVAEWMAECMAERMAECMAEWMAECMAEWMAECVAEWMAECVAEWMDVCVQQADTLKGKGLPWRNTGYTAATDWLKKAKDCRSLS